MVFFCVWPYVVPLIIFFPNAPNGCRDMTRQNWVVFSKVFGLYYRKLPRIDSDFDRVQIFLPRAGEMTRKLSRGNEGRIWGSKMAPKNPRNKTLRIWAPYALDPWDEVVLCNQNWKIGKIIPSKILRKLKNWQDHPQNTDIKLIGPESGFWKYLRLISFIIKVVPLFFSFSFCMSYESLRFITKGSQHYLCISPYVMSDASTRGEREEKKETNYKVNLIDQRFCQM